MATRRTTKAFAEVEETTDEEVVETPSAVVAEKETVVADDLVSCRVKGTWTMYWGRSSFEFEDGKRYRLPKDLYGYLRANGNIYDTL
jgi:hypothetical protein